MAQVFLGLGSNQGNRRGRIEQALSLLAERDDLRVEAVSPVLETQAEGGPDGQGAFLNVAARVETSLAPLELLDALQDVERQMGRARTARWQQRPIDIDILLYDERVVAHPRLNIPHLRLRLRHFVLEPLAAIAPHAVDPITGLTVRQLLDRL